MKNLLKLLIMPLPLMFQMGCVQGSMNNELASLRNSLSKNAVHSVVVLRMPDRILTRTAITPQALRQLSPPARKYTIEMTPLRSALLMKWMSDVKLARPKWSPSVYWGLLFIDRNGKEIGSIFSDPFGKLGYVDGHKVKFSGVSTIDFIHAFVGPEIE